ncbi:MerR family transcriptional regulator [Erythrobacter sp.]|uniref:MerR family transcriptional regulator n=1 Tax=Erythrobacter sp. TaxID=1042 RepID=UPI0025D196F3|nr:MerR family transcriptional regulator [Erythrobacter sp.]
MTEFGDGKDEGALRTIGEVSEALGIKPHVLRYWEQQFPLLKPLKRSGGRRYYRPSDVAMVEAIDRLVNREGYTLKGAEAVLRASSKGALDRRALDRRDGDRRAAADSDPGPGVRLMVTEAPDMAETVAGLKAIRARLAAALDA